MFLIINTEYTVTKTLADSMSNVLPATTMLPTNIEIPMGITIFFHMDCKGYRHQQVDKNSINTYQSR